MGPVGGQAGWLWVDNRVVNEYGSCVGPHALAVYLAFARFADKPARSGAVAYRHVRAGRAGGVVTSA
ncbi:MAG: hypothetical protein MUC34_17250 [Anaerolineae bacterium]|jgi:hypothetical protein|nr:hypothetical protein [Anaerolineae bacterium]